MGYYIEVPSPRGKAQQIAQMYNGQIISKPVFSQVPADKAVIVTLDNGPFEAAGFAFNQAEFDAFTEPDDPRRKQYVLIDLELAKQLTRFRG